uniref:Uncharacterized protein n=1 Tax=Chrysotila carterae TaxID=13221 RepID=A0A7S4B8Y1_CHRCT
MLTTPGRLSPATGPSYTPSRHTIRAVQRCFTTLDLQRRRWAALTERGKVALKALVNAEQQLRISYADGWAELQIPFVDEVQSAVIASLLARQYECESGVRAVLDELDDVVQEMRTATQMLRARTNASPPPPSSSLLSPRSPSQSPFPSPYWNGGQNWQIGQYGDMSCASPCMYGCV